MEEMLVKRVHYLEMGFFFLSFGDLRFINK